MPREGVMNTAVMFSSATDEWQTPQTLYDQVNAEFNVGLDVAATWENRKHSLYLGPDQNVNEWRDGLVVDWGSLLRQQYGRCNGVACYMNPPYSRGLQAKFIRKAAQERLRGVLTVALLPARTDTKFFHECIYNAQTWQPRDGIEIRFLPGRLKFGGATNSAPFPSMIVIFRP